ncbi:MAG: M56 family metallopeptidase, partial [Thermoguttaceae bacterium]
EDSSEPIRQGILKHELSHARHHDGLKTLFLSLIATIHWFNPFVWFALRKFTEAAEWRCDSEAFGSEKNGTAAFAESMLMLNQNKPKYFAWVQLYKNHDVKERIKRLKNYPLTLKESTMKKIGILTLVYMLFCFGLMKVQLVAETPKADSVKVENAPDDTSKSADDKDDTDEGFVTGGGPGVSGFTHLVTFKPKGNFNPRNPMQFLVPFNAKIMDEGPTTGYFRTKAVDGKLVGSLCTGDPEKLEKLIESLPKIEFVKSERLTKESFEKYEKTEQESLPPVDGGFATEGTPGVAGFTHIVTFKPKGDFNPRNPMQFLLPFRAKLVNEGPATGYFRTKAVDGKLVGSLCTDDPEELKKFIESLPEIEFVSSERLTKESFEKYEKTIQESVRTGDGYATPEAGFTHLIVFEPAGDFIPKKPMEYLNLIRPKLAESGVHAGYFRTKPEDGKLIAYFLTSTPEEFKKFVDSFPELKYIRTEPLTQEMFEKYEKTPQLSILAPELEKRLDEIKNTDWFQKLTPRQQVSYLSTETNFSYALDPKNFEVGNARDEFESKWVKLLEGPEPGNPGGTKLSAYDEAILGLATIKSDKAAKLLTKIAGEKVVKDNAHRWYATHALGMLGDPSVVVDLIPLLYHYNSNTRWGAQVALVRLTGENFGDDEHAWADWYNANRDTLGKDLPELDSKPVDWTCGSDDPDLKKWADREWQKKNDARWNN